MRTPVQSRRRHQLRSRQSHRRHQLRSRQSHRRHQLRSRQSHRRHQLRSRQLNSLAATQMTTAPRRPWMIYRGATRK
uniref:Sperm protamine P1 n=1 Tax=Macrostomum lignano TaxID=282301 RepID=A0A1I8FLI1_9PLAT